MELTLDQALQKGIEAHKAGHAQEADRYYTPILKLIPNILMLIITWAYWPLVSAKSSKHYPF